MASPARGLAVVIALLAVAEIGTAQERRPQEVQQEVLPQEEPPTSKVPHTSEESPPTRELDAHAQRLDCAWDDGDRLAAEIFALPATLAGILSQVAAGEPLIVRDFPVAPGERSDVLFERFDVYAKEARVWVLGGRRARDQVRSARVHLLGSDLADPLVRVGFSLDVGGANGSGLVSTPRGVFELEQLVSDDPILSRYEIGSSLDERLGIETRTTCGTSDPHPLEGPLRTPPDARPERAGSSPTHEAILALDTDGEFLADYGNDTVAANDAIGDLIMSLNVIYERDLGLRVLQGETVLRTDPATDPYDSSSTSVQLDEVGDWWEANQAGVDRVWVALLSGKGFSNGGSCSGAGIAWVDSYCDPTVSGGPFDGGSYSATQILRCVALDGTSNTNLIGHEVGHNAGSGHTHCYSPEVDQCYNAQSGCYSGSPSCPDHSAVIPGITPGKGTVMSYCNFSPPNGAGCGSTEPFFHPTVVARIQQSIDANTPSCVELIADSADLSVEKSDSEDPVGTGTGLVYAVTVTNLGPDTATGVVVTEALPTGATLSSTTGCAEDPAGVPTCTLGDIPDGESVRYDITVFVEHSAPASLTNNVTLSAATADPVAGNDTAMEVTAIVTWACQAASYELTSLDNAAAGPFVTEGSITAGSGYEVAGDETILFRAAAGLLFEDGFRVSGTFTAAFDPLIDCP